MKLRNKLVNKELLAGELNPLAWAWYMKGTKAQELVKAHGYFAGTAWVRGDEDFEAVSGSKFGFIDEWGVEYVTDKRDMDRVTVQEILDNVTVFQVSKEYVLPMDADIHESLRNEMEDEFIGDKGWKFYPRDILKKFIR